MKVVNLSIRAKLVIAMLMAVIISTSIVGYIGYSKSKELLVSHLQQSDLPNLLQRIRNAVGDNISETATNIASSSQALTNMATQLDSLVKRFKI